MNTSVPKTERIHALDSLRAIMMLLGLVIHSALTYGVIDYEDAWILKDPVSIHILFDYMSFLIHLFRMPIFFVVAGFFGGMLFYERGPLKMIKNRVARIVYPFIVFVFILWPIIVFSFDYTIAIFSGNEDPLVFALASFSNLSILIPRHAFHLWFLYYLILFTITSFVLGHIFKRLQIISGKIKQLFSWIIQMPLLRLFIFSAFTYLMLFFMKSPSATHSTSFILDINTYVYFFFFYIFGWILFKCKSQLSELMKCCWLFTCLGVLLSFFEAVMFDTLSLELLMVITAVLTGLLSFGITGLFLRYASKYSPRMRYISDSSYWIYLVHLPLTAIIPGLIAEWNLPSFLKFLVVLLTTTLICVVSYHYIVRSTFIGEFLNGRKYQRKM